MNASIQKWLRRGAKLGLCLVATGGILWLGLQLAVAWVPLPAELFQPFPENITLLDRHGERLRSELLDGRRYHRHCALAEIPPHLIEATLAAEDRRFRDHHGVDWTAIARATKDLVRKGRVVSGASTITQQLIKIHHPRPRTFFTKVSEMLQAMRLEQLWSKEQILEAYLNRLDYGNLCFGADTAARFYFQKPVQDLTLAESALLAGLPNSPSRLNPVKHPLRARARQRLVLDRMFRNGTLADTQHADALSQRWDIVPIRHKEAEHYSEWVSAQETSRGFPLRGEIRTTLDLQLQRVAETLLREQLRKVSSLHIQHGAVVVIDNRSGDLLAMIGSPDYHANEGGQVNGALAPRSAGSTFKPFTFVIAIERGMTPATVIADIPSEFATPTGVFRPENYDRHYSGPVRARVALGNSLNIPAVKTLTSAGGPEVLRDALRRCGLSTLNRDAVHYGLGLTIGNAEARLLELANAYACLARLGIHRPLRVFDAESSESKRVFDERATYLVADMLSDNAARARTFGLDSALAFNFPVACKTGTSSDYRDNWAFGYTPEFTVGVWVGNFDGSPMEKVSGVTGAAPVMHGLIQHLRDRFGTSWYARPAGMVEAIIHPTTGHRLRNAAGRTDGVTELFLAENLPPMESDSDYAAAGRILLGPEYAGWLRSADNNRGASVALASLSPSSTVRVISPLPGSKYYIDPDLPGSGRMIPLQLNVSVQARWSSDTLQCLDENGAGYAFLKPGRHRLFAELDGRQMETWIDVEDR